VVAASIGTMWVRRWGGVPSSTPSWPWYFSFPFYIFWWPRAAAAWLATGLPMVAAAAAGVIAVYRAHLRWSLRVALTALLLAVLALAVGLLRQGPPGWWEPLAYHGEYPGGVGVVHDAGGIRAFLGSFPGLLPSLPSHATGHPPGPMVFYALVASVWPGIAGAALATVAIGCLGAVNAGGLAHDELGETGGRLALALWALSPVVILYTATSADAVFAVALAGAALASHRGLIRRSPAWTVAGGGLLWVSSLLTYAAVLVLPFLLVRALGRARTERGWVLRWAAATTAVVLGLYALLRLTTGFDVAAAVAAVNGAYQHAPGSASREPWLWLPGDLVAFGGMLGLPLLAALVVLAVQVVRERMWTSFDAAALASFLTAAAWGFSKGEVERIFLFLAPLLLVPAARQLSTWRVRLPILAALLLAQAVAVELLFYTRW
jgi:methylthioxylose transferase